MTDPDVLDLFELDREDQRESIKNQLETAIETYPRDWRLVQEPLQNAIDSFFAPDTGVYTRPPDGRQPRVEVTLNLDENWVSVRDNGLGIPIAQFKVLFYPYTTKKRRDGDRSYRRALKGSQGIGLKATIFSSELFELSTVNAGQRWSYARTDLDQFGTPAFDSKLEKPTPSPTTDPSGTLVRIRLRNFSASEFVAERVTQFATKLQLGLSEDGQRFLYGNQSLTPKLERILWYYFQTQTYAGDLTRYLGFQPALPDVELCVRVVSAETRNLPGIEPIRTAEYRSKVGYFSAKSAYEVSFTARDRATTPFIDEPWYSLVERDRRLEGSIYETQIWGDEIPKLLGTFARSAAGSSNPFTFVPPDSDRLRQFRTALARVNGIKIVIARAETLRWRLGLPTDQIIAVNGLVTDIPLNLGRVGNTGYRSSTHIVIDIDGTLGVGKRNLGGDLVVHGRTRDTIDQFYTAIWRNIARTAQLITKEPDEGITGIRNDYTEDDLRVNLDEATQRRLAEMFGRITVPASELDVLQAHQYWLGRHALAPSLIRMHGQRRYDGVLRMGGHDLILEYKVDPEELARNDCDATHPQKLRDIDIAVSWLRPSQERLPENYRIRTPDQEVREWRAKYPGDLRLFPSSAMYRLYRQPDSEENLDSVFVLALEDIWEH